MVTGERSDAVLAPFRWADSLPKRERRRLARLVDVVEAGAGAVVATAGRTAGWVVLVIDGAVVVDDGRVLTRGSAFGVLEALHNDAYRATARVRDRATVGFIERRAFIGALATVPSLAVQVLRDLTRPVDPVPAARRHLRPVPA